MTGRNNDAPKVGVLHGQSNLWRSPQTPLEGVSKSSLDTKKNRDFQNLKDEGRPLTILVLPRNQLIIPVLLRLFKTVQVDELVYLKYASICSG